MFYLKQESVFERYADEAAIEYASQEEERKKSDEAKRLKYEKRDNEKRQR